MSGGIHQALDRLRFGPRRTLNVRDGLLSSAEASRRVDSWMRGKQVELGGEVLVVTGRGAGSPDGIPVVREATRRTLLALKRSGVVSAIHEDTPGSFVVILAPLRALFEAPNRRKRSPVPSSRERLAVSGIDSSTHDRLRALAVQSLESLGVVNGAEDVIADEMRRQFSLLVSAAPAGTPIDRWLSQAVQRALREYEESSR